MPDDKSNDFTIVIEPAAQRDMKNLSREVATRIDKRIRPLSQDPYPYGARKLTDKDNIHRIRVGDYRVLYQVNEESSIVRILRVKHRRDVYRH